MTTPVLHGDIAPFFRNLLANYRAGKINTDRAMRYAVAIFICGRSGSGKDTLRKYILQNDTRLGRIITTTTRPPEMRNGRLERSGEDYFFVDSNQFEIMWDVGSLLERDTFAGNHYGCSVVGVLTTLSSGKIPILQITYEGVEAVLPKLEHDARSRGIFVTASRPVVEARIRARAQQSGTPVDDESLLRRLSEGDEEEARFKPKFVQPFGSVIDNDDLATAQSQTLSQARFMIDYLESRCIAAIRS